MLSSLNKYPEQVTEERGLSLHRGLAKTLLHILAALFVAAGLAFPVLRTYGTEWTASKELDIGDLDYSQVQQKMDEFRQWNPAAICSERDVDFASITSAAWEEDSLMASIEMAMSVCEPVVMQQLLSGEAPPDTFSMESFCPEMYSSLKPIASIVELARQQNDGVMEEILGGGLVTPVLLTRSQLNKTERMLEERFKKLATTRIMAQVNFTSAWAAMNRMFSTASADFASKDEFDCSSEDIATTCPWRATEEMRGNGTRLGNGSRLGYGSDLCSYCQRKLVVKKHCFSDESPSWLSLGALANRVYHGIMEPATAEAASCLEFDSTFLAAIDHEGYRADQEEYEHYLSVCDRLECSTYFWHEICDGIFCKPYFKEFLSWLAEYAGIFANSRHQIYYDGLRQGFIKDVNITINETVYLAACNPTKLHWQVNEHKSAEQIFVELIAVLGGLFAVVGALMVPIGRCIDVAMKDDEKLPQLAELHDAVQRHSVHIDEKAPPHSQLAELRDEVQQLRNDKDTQSEELAQLRNEIQGLWSRIQNLNLNDVTQVPPTGAQHCMQIC